MRYSLQYRLRAQASSGRGKDRMIKKQGEKWVVTTKSGRVLGKHDSEKKALRQLAAIEASKARRKK